MRRALLLLAVAAVDAGMPPSPPMSTSFKFVFTATRDPEADAVQLAEVVLYDTNGSPIEILTASNPGGSPPVCPVFSHCQSEMPDMAVDGNIDTHWTDYGEGCDGRTCPEGVPHTRSLVLSLVNNTQVGSEGKVLALPPLGSLFTGSRYQLHSEPLLSRCFLMP